MLVQEKRKGNNIFPTTIGKMGSYNSTFRRAVRPWNLTFSMFFFYPEKPTNLLVLDLEGCVSQVNENKKVFLGTVLVRNCF